MEKNIECKGVITIDKEVIKKIVEERTKKMRKEYKEEIEELREEVERLKGKIRRMEQTEGKRKRDECEEREGKVYKRKWWYEEEEGSDEDEKGRRNLIIRVEKERWGKEGSNCSKIKSLFTDGLRIKADVREISMIGQRGEWITIIVKMESEEDKWKVLEARRKEGSKMKVKIDEDKPLQTRINERKETERRKKRRERESRRTDKSTEKEIIEKMEENLLMDTDEEEADREKKI